MMNRPYEPDETRAQRAAREQRYRDWKATANLTLRQRLVIAAGEVLTVLAQGPRGWRGRRNAQGGTRKRL